MGICKQIDGYEREILQRLNMDYKGLKWCGFGNQWTYENDKPTKAAKIAYTLRGVDHTSIDINGQDGALKLDLDKPIPKDLLGKFDVVTNYGTTEHINNQLVVLQNINNLCRNGGIMLHIIPLTSNWENHCRYHYTPEFIHSLKETCGYELIDLRLINKEAYKYPKILIAAALKKGDKNNPDFTQIRGIEDSGDTTFTGDYMSLTRYSRRKVQALKRRLQLRLFGYAYVGHRTKPGWSGYLPFFCFRCPEHGLVENYLQGEEERLDCPLCRRHLK